MTNKKQKEPMTEIERRVEELDKQTCKKHINQSLTDFAEKIKEEGYPNHFCGSKKCKCYNKKAKENNALIIEIEIIDKILKEMKEK